MFNKLNDPGNDCWPRFPPKQPELNFDRFIDLALFSYPFLKNVGLGLGCKFAGYRNNPPRNPMPKIINCLPQTREHRQGSAKIFKSLPRTCQDPANNLPRTIHVNDGTDPTSHIYSSQFTKRITARQSADAGAALSTPHGVFNKLAHRPC